VKAVAAAHHHSRAGGGVGVAKISVVALVVHREPSIRGKPVAQPSRSAIARGGHPWAGAAGQGRAQAAPGLVAAARELRNAPWRHADDLGDDALRQAGVEGAHDRPVALAQQTLAFAFEFGQPAAVRGGEALERGQRPGVAPAAGTDHTPVVRRDTAAVLPRCVLLTE
jgi:hypothetical protein